MSTSDAVIALSRFGLGARAGDLGRIAADPRGAILAELAEPGILALDTPGLLPSADALVAIEDDIARRRAMRRQDRTAAGTSDKMAHAGDGMAAEGADKADDESAADRKPKYQRPLSATIYNDEVAARLDKARQVPIGFGERLVAFWSNHFAVEIKRGQPVRGLAGAFEREAIRPHVLGRFSDMLDAVAHHPAMLLSLDNARSIGPHSPLGLRRDRGINENYGRELMELHTVGVDGGYTQADVIQVAYALSGWTVGARKAPAAERGRFVYRGRWHEPGTRTIMGKRYRDTGVGQGEAVLHDLARSPATAHHVMTQFAAAFVADQPPPVLVDALVARFRDTDGDLGAVARTLVGHDAAWSAPRDKLRAPREFLLAGQRALGTPLPTGFALRALKTLGQTPWDPPSPAGFPTDTASWLAPDALEGRLQIAELMAQRDRGDSDPRAVLADVLGAVASTDTRETVARADSRQQALALLLMSPEFQWR
ncbi:MAG TPA: DUF1800 family protein [Hyphomicrobiales bacterium]|nr:DUF1800 family protein [Hyphomicrobiales bacterium]